MEKVFTLENIDIFDEFAKEVRDIVKKDSSPYGCSQSFRFCIIGDDAFKVIAEKYELSQPRDSACSCEFKSVSCKEAKVVSLYYGEYGYSTRNEHREYFTNMFRCTGVEYKGVIMEAITYHGKTASLHLPFDFRKYYNKIPRSWEEQHPEPNKIGSLNDRKAADWRQWLLARRAEYDRIIKDEKGAVTVFLEKVREASKNCDQNRSRINGISGSLYANNLIFSYTIDDGHINQKISVDYRGETCLDTFLKMIDGKF